MTAEKPEDHHAKLAWAERHLLSLEADVATFMAQEPYTARLEVRAAENRVVAVVDKFAPMPPEWRFMMGDIIQTCEDPSTTSL